MENTRLIIKYKGKYICRKDTNIITFIKIPNYNNSCSDFFNIDIFVSLLCSKYLGNSYESNKGLSYEEGLDVFEPFCPECIKEVESNIFIYDLDELFVYLPRSILNKYQKNLQKLPKNLVLCNKEQLTKDNKEFNTLTNITIKDETPIYYKSETIEIDNELRYVIKNLHIPRTTKDVLLLYSAGKDSTLAAIRLKNAGYKVHFIHFDNGAMLDSDKPYLTFKNTFANYKDYYFSYENRAVKVEKSFNNYFSAWEKENGILLKDGTIDSEIRCLSCRMAMYTEALIYAKENNFKYIAEGARISQKFMIEQKEMLDLLQDLACQSSVELLFPVLELEDDFQEKQELLKNGFSSKSWESKCLLGRKTKEKTIDDKKIIINYYEENIKPKMLQKIIN